ncbi:MAG: M23 family metallopeptidase [Lachnospiraceae bacterium]|nr:M23 family metallopeptidase [Lachnospiraceae bacterium]
MKKVRVTHKRNKSAFVITSLVTLFICMMFTKGFTKFEHTGNNVFRIYVNDHYVGIIENGENAEHLLIEARRCVAQEKNTLLFMNGELRVEGEEMIYGTVDDEETVQLAMQEVLRGTIKETIQKSCTVKIEDYMVNLNNLDEAQKLLQAAIDKYDSTGSFVVELEYGDNHNLKVICPQVIKTDSDEEPVEEEDRFLPVEGFAAYLENLGLNGNVEQEEIALEDYETGVLSMRFIEDVEISEGYLPKTQVTDLQEAIDYVTKEQETPGEYTVKAGDTLSGISLAVNIPMQTLVELNSGVLESVNSTIRIGQILTITVPEPEINIERIERVYIEEIYDEPVIYIDNDEWYTTQSQVIQQPSSGFRRAVMDIRYVNDKEKEKTTLAEEILIEAVPKIVERGTKVPPTYIKPLDGGRISSYFGYRKSPGGIGSTYHQGIDWATPTGTPVYASSGGTVIYSGWASGYGYCVTIQHPDGRQTRYAHNSRLACTVGQYVNQGQVIAYSGSTGNSTGPHVHFEIIINGVRVNPFDYLG